MNSFNSYGQTTERFGGNIPVWLGTVKPIPVGAVLNADPEDGGLFPLHIKAGTPVMYNPDNRTFIPWNGSNGTPNGYLYNDIYVKEKPAEREHFATGAIVTHHAEGLLINRTDFAEKAYELLQYIPGVALVFDSFAEGEQGGGGSVGPM